ncbi:MAG: bifunctional diaminohydroxyphosphoribosylaminopyrimidine deaminase/5-amino-6-(5-phosphoribosylamino)uracil reductase RibD [Gammaproteobacteria bacterium]|nr:bifunctional diaminohydroxyphosphoribosylaminopyrimidine deaminase/5-amino-6-(5-phosphoribosylamino)uracil reductase RibD [Gammaproteobacteria bacterium]
MTQADDFRYMAQAIRLANRGLFTADPNPRVGCVLVNKNEIVGQGWHERAGEAHAEIMALREAGAAAEGATAYVSLEPCCHHGKTPPCSEALIKAGVARIVVAMEDPNPQVAGKGVSQLREADIDIETGVMTAQAEILNPGFIQRMRHGRPFVRCKMAMSLDGRTAMASGESQWITGESARMDVHKLRARSSAIVTGVDTVLADDPSMNARLENEKILQPVRVVLDSQLRMPVDARMLSLPGRTIVCTTAKAVQKNEEKIEKLKAAGAELVQLHKENNKISLPALLMFLSAENFNEVLLETGATLSGAFMQAGLVDELVIYMAPLLMGDSARGLFSLPNISQMSEVGNLEITDVRSIGKDWRIISKPKIAVPTAPT